MSCLNDKSEKKKRLTLPVIVEGRYDKSAILSIFSGTVITTEGFGIFNNKEKRALIQKLGEDGIIILTDSDGGGKQIRSFITGIIPGDKIINLYIPELPGKEKRKTKAGKAGLLGVEGVGGDVLRKLLLPYTEDGEAPANGGIQKIDLYNEGFFGQINSSVLRDRLCEKLGLPTGMNAKTLLSALNIILDRESFLTLVTEFDN